MDRGAWWATVHGVAKSWTSILGSFTFLVLKYQIMVMITFTSRGCHTLKFPFLDIEGHLKGFSASAEKCRLILSSSNN